MIGSPTSPLTILIVDDDPDIRALLRHWLAGRPYEVRLASSAIEALDASRREHINVVLCDVMMPDRDGLWLVEQLGQVSPGTRVIFGTAVDDLSPAFTLRPSVCSYLVKPFQRSQLIGAIENALLTSVSAPGDARHAF